MAWRRVAAEADKFIGGKLLGKELLGLYAVASHLASLPIDKLAGLIRSVAFPTFSTVQTELEKARSYLLKAVRVMSVVAFPVFLGISSVAPELIALFLGEKWDAAALPLQILAVVMPIRMISTLLSPVLWGTGRPLVSATNFLIAAIVMPIAFVFGARWGPAGLALAWLSAYPAVFLISVYRASRAVGFLAKDFIMAMVKPAAAAACMYVAVESARPFTTGDATDVLHLVELIFVGAITYSGIMFVINRDALSETMALIRQ